MIYVFTLINNRHIVTTSKTKMECKEMKKWAVLKDVNGITSETSLTAWAGEPFKTFDSSSEALSECLKINKIYKENGILDVAYVASGVMTEKGFILDLND